MLDALHVPHVGVKAAKPCALGSRQQATRGNNQGFIIITVFITFIQGVYIFVYLTQTMSVGYTV